MSDGLLVLSRRARFGQTSRMAAALAVAGLLLCGCGDKATTSPTAAGLSDEQKAMLATLTQSLRRYCVEQKRAPTNFAELQAAGYVKDLPPAPSGRKYALSPKGTQVVLVSE